MLKYNLYINDILRAIKDIYETTKAKNFDMFSKDKNLVDATAMRIQIIGESVKKLPSKFKKKKKNIKWVYLENLRNLISHAYFKVDPKLLWNIVKKEIPPLRKVILKMKKEIN